MSTEAVESTVSQAQQQGQGASRTKLVQRLLGAGTSLPAFMNDMLTTQAVVVAGTEAAGFLIQGHDEQGFSLQPVAHIRPDESDAQTRAAALAAFQEIIKPCVKAQKDGAIEIGSPDEAGETQFCLVTLLRSEQNVVAASGVITRCRDAERARQRLMSMQLVAGYFDLFNLRRQSEQARQMAQAHQHVLQLTTAVATSEGFKATGANLCNELATRTGAVRVSLGWVHGQRVKCKALSHTEKFDRKQELVVLIERTMEECLDQEEQVFFSPDGRSTPNVTRDAQALSRAFGNNHVVSIPLRRKDIVVGVLTLEFLQEHRITDQTITALGIATELLAPQLDDRFQNDRWLIVKTGVSLKNLLSGFMGPRYMLTKLLVFLGIGLIVFLSVYRTTYNVAAAFQFVPEQRRVISAPFEGTIAEVAVREGQAVKRGDLLLRMHDAELIKQKARADARAAVSSNEAQAYLDRGETPQYSIAIAQRDEALAESAYYQLLIEQSRVTAPIDGVVLRGDQEPNVYARVSQGQELFEVGPPDSLLVELLVKERDIADVRLGQRGYISTASLPDRTFAVTVDRIVPLGQAKDASNVFRVFARLDQHDPSWKPGMAGEARLEVAPRTLMWQWTHRLVEWLQLKLWIW